MSTPRFILTLLVLALTGALRAQAALPPGGTPLLATDASGELRLTTTPGNADAAIATTVNVTGTAFKTARRVETLRDLSPAWAVELHAKLTQAAAKGDVALVHFSARTIAASDETGGGQLRAAVQQIAPDYAQSADAQFTVRRDWQDFFVPFTFTRDFAAGEAELVFGFGYKRQTIEVGGCEVIDYGASVPLAALPKTRFTYAGREPDAPWRRDALASIEKIRKGDFALRVIDAAGTPVSGAKVRIEQRNSVFQFGSALQFARLVNDTPENLRYREKALELFNAGSAENDLKWPVWAGEWDSGYSREQALRALHWLQDHHIHMRGHVLVYPAWRGTDKLPKSLHALVGTPRQSEIPQLVLDHIADETGATRGLVEEWDVINEPWDNHELMDLFGRDIMVDWFKAARSALPDTRLVLNDYSNHDATTDAPHVRDFENQVSFLLEKKAPVTGLGIQAHIGSTPNDPVHVLAVLDRYATFNLPIRVTEFDINTDDEELQADYTRDFLTLMFSHPSVIGFQMWGFWESAHWRPRGAMYRKDWSEKPNAKAYRDLVLEKWRTKIASETDAHGNFFARGFHGEYAIYVEKDGRKAQAEFVLRPGAKSATIEVPLQ